MLKSNGAFRAVRCTEVVRISEGPLKGGSTVDFAIGLGGAYIRVAPILRYLLVFHIQFCLHIFPTPVCMYHKYAFILIWLYKASDSCSESLLSQFSKQS